MSEWKPNWQFESAALVPVKVNKLGTMPMGTAILYDNLNLFVMRLPFVAGSTTALDRGKFVYSPERHSWTRVNEASIGW